MKLRDHIKKYRSRRKESISVGKVVLFDGRLYNKAIVSSISGKKVNLIVAFDEKYTISDLENGKITGMEFSKHVDEVIIKPRLTPEAASNGIKFILANKIKRHSAGPNTIKWSKDLEEDLMKFIRCKPIVGIDADGNRANYVEYEKDGEKYLIPAYSVVPIPESMYNDNNVGITSDWKFTENKDEIVIPIGRKPEISAEDVKRALSITIDARKKSALTNLSNIRGEITQLTDSLAGKHVFMKEIMDDLDLMDKVTVSDPQIDRARKILTTQWEDFKSEMGDDGGPKLTFAGNIEIEHDDRRFDGGYITVEIKYAPYGSGGNPSIKISGSKPQGGHPHPYVNSGGTPCFGGNDAKYARILGSGDVEALGTFLHSFLSRPVGSGYRSISTWPEIKK